MPGADGQWPALCGLWNLLSPDAWEIACHGTIARFGITSEMIVARPVPIAGNGAADGELR
jgi:hypothetical protein